ncbi:MAG: dTDP-4-dehydrorhamnose reductase [Bacteroidales bacterium]|nr:dTDP-4-dehydrorhamnose reductase [Bacteroidales bacterium]
MAKTILITGANGQLGNEMRNLLSANEEFSPIFTDVQELDITSREAIDAFFAQHPIHYVVNCAAYTAVDNAEDNAALCERLNADAVQYLAEAAKRHGAKMVQVSTDYVFDGCAHRPYREDDATAPCSVYGTTKLDGEQRLLGIMPTDAIIFRTAWLYSPYGKNFVKTMLTLGRTKDALKVIFDQVGTPTYAKDLAIAIITAIKAPQWHAGIYHFSDEGAISWYDFTKAIHRIAGISGCEVSPCTTAEYPTKARRPHYSVLDKSKYKSTFQATVPYWADSLAECITRIENQ